MPDARAVATRTVAPLRVANEPNSEMVSQLILGETVTVLEHGHHTVRVQCNDGYVGWVAEDHIAILETAEQYPSPKRFAMIGPLFQPVYREPDSRSERITLLTVGTTVEIGTGYPGKEFCPLRLPNGQLGYVELSALIVPEFPDDQILGPNLVLIARSWIGVPYLWGGRSPFGTDCSGFVQRIYRLCGRDLPRDAYQQYGDSRIQPVLRSELQPGDLVFFAGPNDPRRRGVTHVGIAMGDGRFIHASSLLGVVATPLTASPYDREFHAAGRFGS